MDKLFCNAVIHTGRSEHEVFGAMLVRGDRIVKLFHGKRPKLRKNNDKKIIEIIDLKRKHVYPCLIDGHVHLLLTLASMAMGFALCEITSEGVRPNTLQGVAERLRAYAAGQKKNQIIAASNYILSVMDEKRMPTRQELDDWCGNRPVVIYNIDGHSTSLSTAMMKMLGMNPAEHNGVLAGEENERAQGRIISLVGNQMTLPALAKGVAQVQNTCASYGIGMIGALEGNGDSKKDPTTGLIARLASRFDMDVRLYLQYTDLKRVRAYDSFLKACRVGGCGDWEMDGSVGSHSAAFRLPYKDTGKTSPCYFSQNQVNTLVKEATEAGYQIASHAIGDAAIERLLAAYEKYPSPRLHRIEHGEFMNQHSFERIIRGHYAVMMQPGYSWIDKRYLHTYEQFLPQEILGKMRLRSLYDAGVCICGSSDSPVQSMDPYLQMLGMVEFYREEESMTPYEAFRCYTVHAARAMESDEYGTLEPGKVASFFVARENFFNLKPEELIAFRPEETWYHGEKYQYKKGTIGELVKILLKKRKMI